jgi:hypothetical protein
MKVILKIINNNIKYLKDFFVGKVILDCQSQGYIT